MKGFKNVFDYSPSLSVVSNLKSVSQKRSFASLLGACALLLGTLGISSSAFAQSALVKKNYPQGLPAKTKTYPNYQRPSSVASTLDVFWEGVKDQETRNTHWEGNVPIPGRGDGSKVISIGISQVSFDYNGASTGPEKASYAGVGSWDWEQYVWNPIYNEKLGRGIYMRDAGSRRANGVHNSPCLAFSDYNGGRGWTNQWKQMNYSSDKFPNGNRAPYNYIQEAIGHVRREAARFGKSEEVDYILRTQPGCSAKMEDIDPSIPVTMDFDGETLAAVEGYCSEEAKKWLTEGYQEQQKDLDSTLEPLIRQIKTGGNASTSSSGSSSGSSGSSSSSGTIANLGSCVDMSWPNVSFQYPTMDQIIRGVAREAVNKACSAARKAVSEQTSGLSGNFYMNTRIPGVSQSAISVKVKGMKTTK